MVSKENLIANSKTIIITAVSLTVFVIGWFALSMFLNLPYVPPPDKVFNAFVNSFVHKDIGLGTNMWDNILASLQRVAIGFGLAFVVALPVGLIMGFFKLWYGFINPVVEVFRPIPPIAWVPTFLLVFSIYWGPVMVVFLGILFPLLSNIILGVRSVDKPLIDAAKTMGAKRIHLFTKVVLPYIIPFMMAGITIGLGIGWMCIVAAEIIGAVGGGVGFYIWYMQGLSKYDYEFAGMVVIALLGLFTVGVSRIIEKRLNRRMGIK